MPNIYTIIFSILTFVSSFFVFQKYNSNTTNKLIFSLFAFSQILLFAAYQVSDYFTGNGIDHSTIVLMRFGLRGAAWGEYMWLILVTIGLLLASIAMLTIFTFRKGVGNKESSVKKCILTYFLLLVASLANPACINIYNLPSGTFIPSRASKNSSMTEFYKYYKKPILTPLSNETKNIVFIYAESLERAFFNEEIFPDLVPELKKIEQDNISFTNIHLAHGTGGTIWAISASQCGLPLFLPSRSIINHGTGDFLPSATCLGDLLADEGYHLAYYGGASLNFTRKGDFFKTHGFREVLGKDELRPKLANKNYLNFWGLYDDSLFRIGYENFLELSKNEEKFGIFMLTIDTHSPGYPSKSCKDIRYKDGKNKHLNAVACSDYLISDFINKIINSPYADQTIIVLASDHINWNNAPSADLLKKARDGKKNTFMIIEPGISNGKKVTTKGTAFDIGTTLLPFIGYSGQIGLGRNLLDNKKETAEEIAYIQKRLFPWKSEILRFWGQPRIDKSLSVDIQNNTITIDKEKYNIPVFIELTKNLDTSMLFGLRGGFEQYLQKVKPDKKFLIVDKCRSIKTSGDLISDTGMAISNDGWCLVTGKGKKYIFKKRLSENIYFNVPELRSILRIQ